MVKEVELKPDDVSTLRDRRYGQGVCCANCLHAFPVKITLKDNALECRAHPMQSAPAVLLEPHTHNIQAALQSNHAVTRLVPADYFCSLHTPDQLN